MSAYVALFRGINVGGKNTIPMAELREILESLGCSGVSTYIQSGNAVFDADSIDAAAISDAVAERKGFSPSVLILDADGFAKAVEQNPYDHADESPKTVHCYFLSAPPAKDAERRLEDLRASTEAFTLRDRVLYLDAPDGIGRSKLVASVDRAVGAPATGRNWRTIRRLQSMVPE